MYFQPTYRTYRYIGGKDQIIEAARAIRRESKSDDEAHQLSGVHKSTIFNWFDGDTMNPRQSTITAYAAAYGYVRRDELRRDGSVVVNFAKVKTIDVEKEIEKQADWLLARQKREARRKGNGHRKNGHATNGRSRNGNGHGRHARA